MVYPIVSDPQLPKVAAMINSSPRNCGASALNPHTRLHGYTVSKTTKTLGAGLVLAMGLMLSSEAAVVVDPIDLGTASDFAILAGSGVTNAGATTITGDVGSSPTATTAGFSTVTLNGTNHGGDPVTVLAKEDLSLAYADAQGREADTIYPPIFELNGLTLESGVYYDPSSFSLNGTLILDGLNDSSAVWIFQMGSTFTMGANSKVSLINGALASNVFWQVGSSATIGADAEFAGTMMAQTSISLGSGASVDGRLLAQDGAVSLVSNSIAVPEPSSVLLLIAGLAVFLVSKSRTLIKARQDEGAMSLALSTERP